MKKNKYFAKAVRVDGEYYASIKEYRRYKVLELLERAGEITELKRQVRYLLIPSQFEMITDPATGRRKRVCVERECNYVADFVYKDKAGELVVEDCKGYKKGVAYDLFKIKRKLMRQIYGIAILET